MTSSQGSAIRARLRLRAETLAKLLGWTIPTLLVVTALGGTAFLLGIIAVIVLMAYSVSPAFALLMGALNLAIWGTLGLGFWLVRGLLREPRPARRLHRILDRAERGSREAQWVLAMGYGKGDHGLPRDPAQRIWWLRRLAHQGDGRAMAHLALHLWEGHGILKDRKAAVAMAHSALEAGHRAAAVLLRRWEGGDGPTPPGTQG